MDQMTTKERLRNAILGLPVDHLPFSPNLAYLFESLPQEYQAMGHMGLSAHVGADLLNRFAPCPVVFERPDSVVTATTESGDRTTEITSTPVGTLTASYVRSATGETRFLVEHPLKTPGDYKIQLWIEEHTSCRLDLAPVTPVLAEPALAIGMLIPERCKSAFQFMVEHLVGTEKLVFDLYDGTTVVEDLWAIMVNNNRKAVECATQSGYEFFLTWEDSSTQNYSPDMYARFIAPEITQWATILRQHGKHYLQHACGHVQHLLPIMKLQGITGVESLSPVPTGNVTIGQAREMLGAKHCIIGGIEPTKLLHYSVEQLGPYIEETIEQARGGPFVLANSDSCPPGVSMEKLKLAAEIARSTRW